MASKKKINTDALKRLVRLEDAIIAYGTALKREGNDLVGLCPLHDDKKRPSLVVNPKKQLWKCHGPCDMGGSVIDFVMKLEGVGFVDACKSIAQRMNVTLPEDVVDASANEPKVVASYEYFDDKGVLIQIVERWEPARVGEGSKSFLQRVPKELGVDLFDCTKCDAKKGTPCPHDLARYARMNPQRVLYRLKELRAREHETVFIVEGEKCVHAIEGLGLVSTTWAGGANQAKKTWTKEFAAPLKDRRVVIIPDLNKTLNKKTGKIVQSGLEAANDIAVRLEGIAAEVRMLTLPLTGPIAQARGDKADVFEWIADGGTKDALEALAARAPIAGTDESWATSLLRTKTYEVRPTIGNAIKIVKGSDVFRGAFYFDERQLVVYVTRALPWDTKREEYPRAFSDDDAVFGAAWCEDELEATISPETFGKAVWAIARKNRRNPLVDWLNKVGDLWDGKSRLDSWLIRHAGAKDDGYVRAASKAWMISAVARAFKPGDKVDHVIVLEGDQGLRKSALLNALAGDGLFLDHLPEIDSKDAALSLGQCWILEFSELEGMTRGEVTKHKAFVTRRFDVFRPPYDRTTIRVPRGCVFCASTNEEGYLRDPTGNRRWWPIKVNKRVDTAPLLAEREQLWAEAVAAYKAGEKWWFTEPELLRLASEEAAEREATDPWEHTIAERIDGYAWTTVHEMFVALKLEPRQQTMNEQKRVGQILRRLKWWKKSCRAVGSTTGRMEKRWFPPDSPEPGNPNAPPTSGTPPPVTPTGGGEGHGEQQGERHSSTSVTPVAPVTPVPHAGAHAGIDFKSKLPDAREGAAHARALTTSESTEPNRGNTGNRGNGGDSPSTNHVTPDVSPDLLPIDLGATDGVVDELWGDRR
jgi:predicted P-loop ATPase